MSMIGTYASQSFSSNMGQKTVNKQEANLFHKIDAVTAEVAEVAVRLSELSEECGSIRQEKQNVERYLQRKSEQNRVRLMGELQIFQHQINRKVEATRLQTQKIDERITQIKEAQLFTLQMVLSLQRRVQELQIQLGAEAQS